MNEEKTVRLSIGKIKNNNLRRFVMIVAFLPIVLLYTIINIFYFFGWELRIIFVLGKSVIERWNRPRE